MKLEQGILLAAKKDILIFSFFNSSVRRHVKKEFPDWNFDERIHVKKDETAVIVCKLDFYKEKPKNLSTNQLDIIFKTLFSIAILLNIFLFPFYFIINLMLFMTMLYVILVNAKEDMKNELSFLDKTFLADASVLAGNPDRLLSIENELIITNKISGYVCQHIATEEKFWLPEIDINDRFKLLE